MLNIDENKENANWLHGKRVKKVVGKVRSSLYLRKEVKEKIRGIIERAGGILGENGAIIGCDVYTNHLTEIIELGALVCYSGATGALLISNWDDGRNGSKGR